MQAYLEKLQDKGDADSPLFAGVERAVSELSAAGKLRILKGDERLLHLVRFTHCLEHPNNCLHSRLAFFLIVR